MKVIVAVRFGLSDALTAASDVTAIEPVFAGATDALTGDAAAMPFGSSSARAIVRIEGDTGCSRKRSRVAGAGAAMSIRKPSTTSPLVTVCAVPSLSRVSL